MTRPDDPTPSLAPPAAWGLLLARADLGYIGAAIGGVPERALAFLPHAVLVAFEAHAFCRRQLRLDLPDLAWDPELASASRNSGKLFDDKRRDVAELSDDVGRLAEATRAAFRGGWRRRLARALGIHNPDLAVLLFGPTPVATNITLALHAGALPPGPDNVQAGRVAHDLAVGVGQMAGLLGATEPHRAPGPDADDAWSWGDGESGDCFAEAFAGEVPEQYVPLMLLLQGAVATAALVAHTDCCASCHVAAFKHRLVVTHHAARSLVKLENAGPFGGSAGARVRSLLAEPAVGEVLELRPLRNGLVHLGLSDAPPDVFASSDPLGAIVTYYASGRGYDEVDAIVGRALRHLHEALTEWLSTPRRGGVGFAALLRPPRE